MIMHLSCTNNPRVLLWLGTFLLLLLNSPMVHWMLDLELQSLWRELKAQGLPVAGCSRAQELHAVTGYITALRARVYLVGSAFTESKTVAYGRTEPTENLLDFEENPCLPLRS